MECYGKLSVFSILPEVITQSQFGGSATLSSSKQICHSDLFKQYFTKSKLFT